MPTPLFTREQYRETVEAVERNGGNMSAAGRELGLDRRTIGDRLKRGQVLGHHLSDGARSMMEAARLNGLELQGGWQAVLDDEGQKIGNLQFRVSSPQCDQGSILDTISQAFETLKPSEPIPPPEHVEADTLAFLPHADVHFGMKVSEDETGGRPYNRAAAEERFKAGVSHCHHWQRPCHTALILNAGDLLHANDDSDLTPRSKHTLKVEGTHLDNFILAVQLTVYKIDLALMKNQNVVYRGIPGNHDPNIPGPLSVALQSHYRNEPRVQIVVSNDEFWQMNWGNVFLSGHHGHARRPKDVCPVLPGKFPKQWGDATEWHYFTAHLHNYSSELIGSVRHHQLPSVCSIDTHAAWAPYLDTAGMAALMFSKMGGKMQFINVSV